MKSFKQTKIQLIHTIKCTLKEEEPDPLCRDVNCVLEIGQRTLYTIIDFAVSE